MFDARNGGFGQAPKFPHPSAARLADRTICTRGCGERLGQGSNSRGHRAVANVVVTTLEKMARGGVYDQLAGGFHRYSVDERWVVPHFEKMCYDNSELLKTYVHAYQATGNSFFADVARDIIRWMDEWLSDRERGGFYASQDADISMDDDGDYFTWTIDEARAVLTPEEAQVAALHYDINEIGEMHHNPAKNVLFVRASVEEIARRMNLVARTRDRTCWLPRRKKCTPPVCCARLPTSTKRFMSDGMRYAYRHISTRRACCKWMAPGILRCAHSIASSARRGETRQHPGANPILMHVVVVFRSEC